MRLILKVQDVSFTTRGEVCVLNVWETCLGFESVCWETLEVAILSLEHTILSCPFLMSRVDCLRQQVQVSIPCQVSTNMSPLESGEAELPQIRRPLTSPSDAEKRRHETSHLPFREWCEHCVRGRGRAMPHFSRQRRGAEESVLVVQLDYTYMKGVSGPKALSIVDRDTSYGTSSVVLAKGSLDRYAVAMGVQFLDHLGHEEVILQADAEPAAVDVARAIAKSFKGRANVREVPRDSSKSNGTVERFHQSMQGLARTLRCEAIQKYRVPDDDFFLERLLPWIVRHPSWLLSRFQIHTDGNTSYQAIHGHAYSAQTFPFCTDSVGQSRESCTSHRD